MTPGDSATGPGADEPIDWLRIDPARVVPFDRNGGVVTTPYVGKWNTEAASFTTGVTRFAEGAALPLHSHNVEESVLVIAGDARVEVDGVFADLAVGEATWVPANTPHRFINRGAGEMAIYWVYGGRDVTRTITATGETFEHLSDQDRGGTRA